MDKPEGEIITAIVQLKNNKAAGCEEILAEMFKALSNDVVIHLKAYFQMIWDGDDVPQDFRNAI